MARRELKAVGVMMRIEPSLDSILQQILIDEDDTASTFMRALLIREAERRGALDHDQLRNLMGATFSK